MKKLVFLFLLVVCLASCSVSKVPESDQTLTAPEVLALVGDYDEFTLTVRANEIFLGSPETVRVIAEHAYRKEPDGSETHYYRLKADDPIAEERPVIIEFLGRKTHEGEEVFLLPPGTDEWFPVEPSDDAGNFDSIDDFRFYYAQSGLDYAVGFDADSFVKGEDTVIDGRPCYTYTVNLQRIVGEPWDCAVEIAVDKATGLWRKLEGSYTLDGADGEGYLLEEVVSFEENADIIPEIPAH